MGAGWATLSALLEAAPARRGVVAVPGSGRSSHKQQSWSGKENHPDKSEKKAVWDVTSLSHHMREREFLPPPPGVMLRYRRGEGPPAVPPGGVREINPPCAVSTHRSHCCLDKAAQPSGKRMLPQGSPFFRSCRGLSMPLPARWPQLCLHGFCCGFQNRHPLLGRFNSDLQRGRRKTFKFKVVSTDSLDLHYELPADISEGVIAHPSV